MNLFERLLVSIYPEREIPKKYMPEWQGRVRTRTILASRIYFFVLGLLYVLHYFFVDIPLKKEPLSLWFNYRFGALALNVIGFALTFSRSLNRSKYSYAPLLIVGLALGVLQAQSMVWRAEIPYFYCVFISVITTYALPLNILSGSAYYFLSSVVQYNGWQARSHEFPYFLSAALVGWLFVVVSKTKIATEVQAFVFEIEEREAKMALLDTQAELLKRYQLAEKVAHDIRSPLAALEVVAFDSGLNDQTKTLIAKLTTRLHEIANELLRSKIEAGVQSEPILEIQEIIEEKKQTLAKTNRLITFRIRNFQTAERINTRLTSTEFKQIFSNLLDNSIEAIDQRGTIEVQIQKATNELIRIQISDTGKGIPIDILPGLFNKGATHGKTGGNGLGLFQAKEALEKVGGSISIESRLGQGTQVTLSIPILN
ncbi:MAG: sensor histidine kinase [Oligoflexia bacterium]|nr:sensor histidine kinase [Oligoflexia bacterium]